MPVAEPFIDSKTLLMSSPREELKRRLSTRINQLTKNIEIQAIHIRNYEKEAKKWQKQLEDFQSQIDNCMTEEDVRLLCQSAGV